VAKVMKSSEGLGEGGADEKVAHKPTSSVSEASRFSDGRTFDDGIRRAMEIVRRRHGNDWEGNFTLKELEQCLQK